MIMDNEMQRLVGRILKDISIDLGDEFDRNWERQAFFTEKWKRRRSPVRPGRATLVDTGGLRRSVRSQSTATSIRFYSDLPYASIHNDGGEIRVTARMKRYFWAKCYEAQGAFGRRKDGGPRRDRRTVQLTSEAEFWRALALMKVGRSIVIPRRRFLGMSPEVERAVREIIEENLEEYFSNEYKIKKQ